MRADHPSRAPLHVLAKPAGPACNLDCAYCFYLRKAALFPPTTRFRMSDADLELFIRRYLESHDGPEVAFAWQGGEPTLCGVDFFRRAVAIQRRHAGGRTFTNSLQTNGTLLDDEWGAFLAENRFLVGLSFDGPPELHDRYRRDRADRPTFDRVRRGLDVLQRHHVEFNTLTVVSAANVERPIDVYRFLRDAGSRYLQFIPLVECKQGAAADERHPPAGPEVTDATVSPSGFGRFLCRIFDRWVRNDVGRVFVRDFDNALAVWSGLPSPLCTHAETCGRALALEHDGSVYSCDHFVYASHRLGNLRDSTLECLVESPAQTAFGRAKAELPRYCLDCPVLFACRGGCPKHRFALTPNGDPRLNFLCAGYRAFFQHIDAPMRRMAAFLRAGRPAADIMR